jgi:hypothetical protein
MDWRVRQAEKICELPAAVIGEILQKLHALLEL